jgi:hypothetical protein
VILTGLIDQLNFTAGDCIVCARPVLCGLGSKRSANRCISYVVSAIANFPCSLCLRAIRKVD